MTRLAMSARYIDSFSPWWHQTIARFRARRHLGELVVGAEIGGVSDAKAVGSNCGVLADGRDELAVRSTSSAQRACSRIAQERLTGASESA